jgi:hypothetical protein
MSGEHSPAAGQGFAAGSGQARAPQSDLTQLMHMLGSPGGQFDGVPSTSGDFFLDPIPGESPLQQVLAWARAHKVRRGHWKDRQGRLVDYLVDKNGDPVGIKDLAVDLRWTLDKAREYWNRGCGFGLLGGGKPADPLLYLRGNVKRFVAAGSKARHIDPELLRKARTNLFSSPIVLPLYVQRHLSGMEPERRADFERRYQVLVAWGRELERDAIAEGRAALDERKEKLFSVFGVPRQRQPKRRARSKILHLTVLVDKSGQGELSSQPAEQRNGASAPTAVQTSAQSAVHTAAAESVQSTSCKGFKPIVPTSGTAVQAGSSQGQVAEPQADKAATQAPPLKTLETAEESKREGSDCLLASFSGAQIAVSQPDAWHRTRNAVRQHYPESDDQLIDRLATLVSKVAKRAGRPGIIGTQDFDSLVAEAVGHCERSKRGKQVSAGLFLSTVPTCVETWLTQGRAPADLRDLPLSEKTIKSLEFGALLKRAGGRQP